MPDSIDKERRSWNMSRIRSKNTLPELLVRQYLTAHKIRYRLHLKVAGTPDIAITKLKIAIFINGCFWHGHSECKVFRVPKTNTAFWEKKIGENIARDQRKREKLISEGWRVILLWECELEKDRESSLALLVRQITDNIPSPGIKYS